MGRPCIRRWVTNGGPSMSGHKYHAKRMDLDGYHFASHAEARRYRELQLLVLGHAIADLECQPVFPLHVVELYRTGWPIQITTVAKYVADFRYTDLRNGEIVVEDVKGVRTPTYKLKKKLVEAIHGITVREL